jgi:queuosine precursor transporter
MKKWIYLAGYIGTIPAANWMIGNVGTFCISDGPCMIPVGFGMTAPSGVLMVGAALVLRDQVQEHLGTQWSLIGILAGAILSYLLADPFIAIASIVAFGVSELVDFAAYTYLRERGRAFAVAASGLVGAAMDSLAFLYIAFGSIAYIEGQIFGKLVISLIAAIAIKFAIKK